MTQTGNGIGDVIIVGAGGCGLMAALVAAKRGAHVLIVEKTDSPGGGTALSVRGLRLGGTRFQRALGIEDTPEQFARDILERNNQESDPALTLRLAETCSPIADFLADVVGIEFVVGESTFGHSTRRSHAWTADKALTDFLYEAVQQNPSIEVRFSAPVKSLKQKSDGTVIGVVTESGTESAGKVILASGGFGASPELLSKHIPQAVDVPFPGHKGSTGDGIKMGLAAGAAVENMGSFQPYPGYIGPGKQAVSPNIGMAGGILVDQGGKRFADETDYPGGLSTAILGLPDPKAWAVFDERVYLLHEDSTKQFLDSGLLKRASTADELSNSLGIDAGGLIKTMDEYNVIAGKSHDQFGRTLPAPLVAPFYGIMVKVALYHTQGGLKVNLHGQVLRPDDSIIPNLYAGGGAACGVSGTGVEGYLPGNGLLASLGFGMLAAEHAAASLTAKS